jgi:hypothetical protein
MKMATGIEIDGKVVEAFEFGPEDEAELIESVAAIERGEYVSGEELLGRLRRFG